MNQSSLRQGALPRVGSNIASDLLFTHAQDAMRDLARVSPPISLRLAQSPNDLKSFDWMGKTMPKKRVDNDLFELRVAIQNAHKMIVPIQGYDVTQLYHRSASPTFWEDLQKSKEFDLGIQKLNALSDLVQLPHDNLLLENSTGAFWLTANEEKYPGGIVVRMFYTQIIDVIASPFTCVIYPAERNDRGHMRVEVFVKASSFPDKDVLTYKMHPDSSLSAEIVASSKDNLYRMAFLITLDVCELLLALRCLNTKIHLYTPSKAELKRVPSVMQANYDYHVLDLYRDYNELRSMQDVTAVMAGESDEEHAHEREHDHRNRFRRIGNELVYWSPHITPKRYRVL